MSNQDASFQSIEDKDLFMVCSKLNQAALSELPPEYSIRNCRKDELDIWTKIHFDNPEDANQYSDYITQYFTRVYAPKGNLFFEECVFVCDQSDIPIGTAFIWKAYNSFNTLHWFKVTQKFEGKGIGRALLSHLMTKLSANDFPVYLHTHPASFRAIKLYSDFGFQLITDPVVGQRTNDLNLALPYLKTMMPESAYATLQMTQAPANFIAFMDLQTENNF